MSSMFHKGDVSADLLRSERAATDILARLAWPEERFRVALVNNMPDGAILRTEQQFTDLLQAAVGSRLVDMEYYSLPEISRGDAAQRHLAASYKPIDDIWSDPPDAVVVTGTEPRESDLKDEVYWSSLCRLIDRIDDLGIPAMFSCLAAHAAVLRADGIHRHTLADKCFGVFDHEVLTDHPLVADAGPRMLLPHTRWNQVSDSALLRAGYEILSWSQEAGVGFFAKKRRGLWLFCQGHPEYDGANLLREYRRDVSRFLAKERATYPDLPRSYFGESEANLLLAFKQWVLVQPDVGAMEAFPRIAHGAWAWDAWRVPAARIFRKWLACAPMRAKSDGESSHSVHG